MLGFFLGSEEEAAQMGLALTRSYVTIGCLLVRNTFSSYPDQG